MKRSFLRDSILTRCEFAAAIFLTLLLVPLHIRVLKYAGPLWRDEINSLHDAMAPTLKEFCASLVFDWFPMFFSLVLRIWCALGFGNSDFGLRIFGFLIACLVIGAIWLSGWLINRKAPLWPLALFALNPITIHHVDSLRAYGLGTALIVLTFGLVWRLTFKSRHRATIFLAGIVAILSVQSLYANSLLVFAICVGGIVVLIRHRDFRGAALIFAVGLAAAISLLPYAGIVRAAHEFFPLQSSDVTIREIATTGISVLSNLNLLVLCVWILFPAAALALTIFPSLRQRLADSSAPAMEHLLFALTTLLVAIVGTVAFLRSAGFMAPQYLLPFIATASLCLHVFAGTLQKRIGIRLTNLLAAILVAGLFSPSAYAWSKVRATNCDLAAAEIAKYAVPNDFIIVTSVPFGISFQRYYRGPASWSSVVPVRDHTQHRWDMARDAMIKPDPVHPVLSQIEATLKSDHKVFLVGAFPDRDESEPQPLPPAPQTIHGWKFFPYEENWLRRVAYFLDQHGVRGQDLSPLGNQPIDGRENFGVFVISGWQETPRSSIGP